MARILSINILLLLFFRHCAAGVSRSASIVIAYYIKEKKMTFQEAYDFVKSKRNKIYPNSGFVK